MKLQLNKRKRIWKNKWPYNTDKTLGIAGMVSTQFYMSKRYMVQIRFKMNTATDIVVFMVTNDNELN